MTDMNESGFCSLSRGDFAKFINSLMDVQQVGGLAGELIETFELMKWTERGRVGRGEITQSADNTARKVEQND